MTGAFWLDWAALGLSLTNTILLFWLGTMVLLNLERRTLGGWMAAVGLLFGGIFFVSHTAILGYGIQTVSPGTTLWWGVGLLVVMVLPVLWYVMMLWYGGYWIKVPVGDSNSLVKRHRPWAWVMLLFLIGLLAIAWLVQSQPVTGAYPARGLTDSVSVGGVPVVLVLYPIFLLLCMALSLDAVRKPGPSSRLMGDLARAQAKPWLLGASLALLLVSMAVLGVFIWAYQALDGYRITSADLMIIRRFDVLIEALITVAVVLVGQAVVAYEIFTGQSLPRKGFLRQWQSAVLLALGFGFVIGFVFSTNLRPIYGILLSTLMMTLFAALLSWRMVTERQRTIRSLRPFVSGRKRYDQLLQTEGEAVADLEMEEPFLALCREVLGTKTASLIVLGALAPLAGRAMHYPTAREDYDGEEIQAAATNLLPNFSPDTPLVAVEKRNERGFEWAVPLWNQRGLMGALLLGPKLEGGIYSREEIEVAQSSGERVIDAMVSAEITQRLLQLQRRRMTESQVLDQRTRRTLHDEVLQQLHAAILTLDASRSTDGERLDEAIGMITEVHGDVSSLLRNLPGASIPDLSSQGLVGALRELVKVEIGAGFDRVEWDVTVGGDDRAKTLSELETEVLYYAAREALRNAARYGRDQDASEFVLTIRLTGGGGLCLQIEDNGIGIERLSDPQGGGQGLALHSTMMAVIGGELRVESEVGRFTRVVLTLG